MRSPSAAQPPVLHRRWSVMGRCPLLQRGLRARHTSTGKGHLLSLATVGIIAGCRSFPFIVMSLKRRTGSQNSWIGQSLRPSTVLESSIDN